MIEFMYFFFFFSSRRRHTRSLRDWSSDVCSSDLFGHRELARKRRHPVLELRQLVGQVGGQEVAARREHLAELDEDGAECLQRQAQPHPARLGERAKEKQRVQRAREPASRSERELVQPEAQGYPEDLGETKQGSGKPQGEAANLPELAGATRKR